MAKTPICFTPLTDYRFENLCLSSSQFENDLERIALKEGVALKRIRFLVQALSEGSIREGFIKKQGYFSRLFSDESWEEWTESRTELGRVVDLFEDSLQSRIDLAQRLDGNTIRKAIDQARKILKRRVECSLPLTFESLVVTYTGHTLPVYCVTASCRKFNPRKGC